MKFEFTNTKTSPFPLKNCESIAKDIYDNKRNNIIVVDISGSNYFTNLSKILDSLKKNIKAALQKKISVIFWDTKAVSINSLYNTKPDSIPEGGGTDFVKLADFLEYRYGDFSQANNSTLQVNVTLFTDLPLCIESAENYETLYGLFEHYSVTAKLNIIFDQPEDHFCDETLPKSLDEFIKICPVTKLTL